MMLWTTLSEIRICQTKSWNWSLRLRERNIVEGATRCYWYGSHRQGFLEFFSERDSEIFCNNIPGLLQKFGIADDSKYWRFFVNDLKKNLNSFLLHNENKYAWLPIVHPVLVRESYSNWNRFFKIYWKCCLVLNDVKLFLNHRLIRSRVKWNRVPLSRWMIDSSNDRHNRLKWFGKISKIVQDFWIGTVSKLQLESL